MANWNPNGPRNLGGNIQGGGAQLTPGAMGNLAGAFGLAPRPMPPRYQPGFNRMNQAEQGASFNNSRMQPQMPQQNMQPVLAQGTGYQMPGFQPMQNIDPGFNDPMGRDMSAALANQRAQGQWSPQQGQPQQPMQQPQGQGGYGDPRHFAEMANRSDNLVHQGQKIDPNQRQFNEMQNRVQAIQAAGGKMNANQRQFAEAQNRAIKKGLLSKPPM